MLIESNNRFLPLSFLAISGGCGGGRNNTFAIIFSKNAKHYIVLNSKVNHIREISYIGMLIDVALNSIPLVFIATGFIWLFPILQEKIF